MIRDRTTAQLLGTRVLYGGGPESVLCLLVLHDRGEFGRSTADLCVAAASRGLLLASS